MRTLPSQKRGLQYLYCAYRGHSMNHHTNHHAMLIDYWRRFIASTIFTLPIIALTFFTIINSSTDMIISCSLLTGIIFYGGWPFLYGMFHELKHLQIGMMTLIGTALLVGYSYTLAVIFGLPGTVFMWELATLVDIMLLGHIIEMHALRGASSALQKLAALLPHTAHKKLPNGSIVDIPRDQLRNGDIIMVRPGETIAADGTILEGTSDVNQATLTGEAIPVTKTINDTVIAGSLNGNGALTMRVDADAAHSYIAQIIELVEKIMKSKSHLQTLADKAAGVLTIIALVIGIGSGAVWWLVGAHVSFALERMITVIVMACPHALGLAVPLVVATVTSKAAQKGIIVRNRTAFEQAALVDTVIFDKTGTLTQGDFKVQKVIALNASEKEVLKIAASIEQFAEHPLGKAIVAYAQQLDIPLMDVYSMATLPGRGTRSTIKGTQYFVGNQRLMQEHDIPMQEVTDIPSGTPIFVAQEEYVLGVIVVGDTMRSDARETMQALQAKKITVGIITGDIPENAQTIADKLGINLVLAKVLPHQKAEKVKELQQQNKHVAMVGDGINDAPALVAADVGVAVSTGTDVAIESADIIIVANNLKRIVDIIEISAYARRKIKQNLFLATAYNIIAIPLAAGILQPFGIVISPALGALFMALSTALVAINAKI